MLEKNKDSFRICIKFRTELRIPIFDFRLTFLMREDFRIKITITFFSPEKKLKKKQKSKIMIRFFVRNSMQIPKLSLFLF